MNYITDKPEAFELARRTSLPTLESALRSTRFGKWPRRVRTAGFIFLVWTAVGLFEAVPEMLKGFQGPVILGKVLDAWAWALITLALLPIDRKFASTEQSFAALALKFLSLSVPFSLAHTVLAGLLYYPFPGIWWSPLRNSDFAIYYFIGGWVTYFAIVGILQAFRFYNRFLTGQLQLERVERSLIESRLSALRLHLEPHFLFNTLNAISSKAAANPEVQDMVGSLGTLLRHSLDCKDKAQITVEQELELLGHYVSIQEARFGDRIDIRIEAEDEVLPAMMPSMLLQPLVENAIRHGLEDRVSGGSVSVSVSRFRDQLKIAVADDGIGLPEGWEPGNSGGHGLRVTRERLSAMYPGLGEQCLTIRRREGGGTHVTISIPLHDGGSA